MGSLAGAATFGGALGLEAWGYRGGMVTHETEFQVNKYSLDPKITREKIEVYYTPLVTTQVYWQNRAEAGMRVRSSRTGWVSTFSWPLLWVLKGLEGMFLILASGLLAGFWASWRFSEEHNLWFKVRLLEPVPLRLFKTLMGAANASDWAMVGQILAAKSGEGPVESASIYAAYVPEKPGE